MGDGLRLATLAKKGANCVVDAIPVRDFGENELIFVRERLFQICDKFTAAIVTTDLTVTKLVGFRD